MKRCEAQWSVLRLYYALLRSVGAVWNVLRLDRAFCGSIERFEAVLRCSALSSAL